MRSDRRKSKAASSKKKMLIIIGAIVAALILVVALYFGITNRPVDKNDKSTQIVTIEAGSTTDSIANNLYEKDLIRSTFAFKAKSKLKGYDGKYQAGSYALSKSMSMNEIMKIISSGDTAGKTFTVTEGMAIYKIADQLQATGICSSSDFLNEVAYGDFDYDFIDDLPAGQYRLEGYLFPDTYEVPLDATAHQVVDIMLKRFDDVMEEEGFYDDIKDGNMNLNDVITKASIIEKEASAKDEKTKVASVINNRLKINMALGMCSTVAYVQQHDKIIESYNDISVDSPYNTYKYAGLPPGPICSPGVDSIKAAIKPAKTKYLYFVASPKMDGTNVYSETQAQFEKDKAAFEKAYAKYLEEQSK